MDYSWVLVAVLGIAFLPDLFDNDSDAGNDQGDSGDGGSGDGGGSTGGIDDLLGGGTDGGDGSDGDADGGDTDAGDDQDGDASADADEDTAADQDGTEGDDDAGADDEADDVADTSGNEGENGNDAAEDDDVQLVCIDADGSANPVEVADFTIGEDILSISMAPDAVDGTLGVDVQNSDDGEDSMVYVEQELMAILRGTPNATAEDVMVSLVRMAA